MHHKDGSRLTLWLLCSTCYTSHTTGQGTDEDIVVSSARAYAAALNKLLAWQAKQQQRLQEEEELEDHYSHAGAAAAAAAQEDNEEGSGSTGSGGGKGKKGFKEGSSKRLVAA